MSGYIKRIRTTSGDLQIDYNALANLPAKPTLADLGISATPAEVNSVIGVRDTVQNQIDTQQEQIGVLQEQIDRRLQTTGGTLTGDLDMDDHTIINVRTPSQDSDVSTMSYSNSVGLSYRGPASAHSDDLDSPNLPQGVYLIDSNPINGVSNGLLFHLNIVPDMYATQTIISNDASQIWVRTYWNDAWSQYRYIGFGYGTEEEMPTDAQDGQLFYVKV